jgi:protocatechuate 3,4-dioxygenase beta subunit
LLINNDSITPAVGEITHLSGRILSTSGEPIRNAVIEIWQVDSKGAYIHSGSGNADERDKNFQGYGRFMTGSSGEYYFRTLKPVAYPGRAPHIHVIVKKGERRLLTTQLLIAGNPQNDRDGVFRGVRDPLDRELLLAEFKPLKDSKIGELTARFDVVVGVTPEDRGRVRG